MTERTCECGCGELPRIARRNRSEVGHVKGERVRFLRGHSGPARVFLTPGVDWIVENCDFDTPCWMWLKATHWESGYGMYRRYGEQYAHRVVYRHYGNEIPEGMFLDHLCRHPWCVNPDHLEPVTQAENCRRGMAAKVTAEIVRTIRASSERTSVLADRYGITPEHVRNIIKRRAWADV